MVGGTGGCLGAAPTSPQVLRAPPHAPGTPGLFSMPRRSQGWGPSAAGLSMEMEPSPSLVYLGHVAKALKDTM